MLKLLTAKPAELTDAQPSDSDWYLNLLWIDRRKCLLFTHVGTLFPIFAGDVRAAELRPIGTYVAKLIKEQLLDEGFAPDRLGLLDPEQVQLAKTASRAMLGVMNDTARHARHRIEAMGGLDWTNAVFLNRYLRRALHSRDGEYAKPIDLVPQYASTL